MADKEVPLIRAKKTPRKDVILDPNGFFVIEVNRKQNEIRVEHYSNVYKNKRIVSGILEKVFSGNKADALCDTIVKNVPDLLPMHYLYLGESYKELNVLLKKTKNIFKADAKVF